MLCDTKVIHSSFTTIKAVHLAEEHSDIDRHRIVHAFVSFGDVNRFWFIFVVHFVVGGSNINLLWSLLAWVVHLRVSF